MSRYYISIILIFISTLSLGQSRTYTSKDVTKRLNKAAIHHLGIGVGAEMNSSFGVNSDIIYRYGNRRQFLNYSGSIMFGKSFRTEVLPDITTWQFSMDGGVLENILSTSVVSIYLSETVGFNIPFATNYYKYSETVRDNSITKNYISGRLSLGFTFNNWDISFYCKYDLAPIYNQRYIYETINYDYFALRQRINERFKLGLMFRYFINF